VEVVDKSPIGCLDFRHEIVAFDHRNTSST
jgi:hypothetical protein